MIFETIISTIDLNGKVNFAPFGIKKNRGFIFISPYIPSTTLNNIKLTEGATVNYINDSSFFVNCIIGKKKFKKKRCKKINGYFLKEALSHDEIVVESFKDDKIRPTFKCKVVEKFVHERFEGFNRANGSIIEACILASRARILDKKKIISDLNNLSSAVEKTAGKDEIKSWGLIKKYILNETKKI